MNKEFERLIEMGSFTPLVLSTFGGMGGAATTVYKRLASLLSAKRDQSYGLVMSWLRCSISFSLLRSAITGGVYFTERNKSHGTPEV